MIRIATLAFALLLSSACSSLISVLDHPRVGPGRLRGDAPQLSPSAWQNVVAVPDGSLIRVLLRDGRSITGRLSGADLQGVLLEVPGAADHRLARDEVARVDLVRLPGSTARVVARRADGGAVLGVLGAALYVSMLSGTFTLRLPDEILAGSAAGGAAMAGRRAVEERLPRTIYIAPGP
jgi:hypothetical protein